jgi:cytosine/adenosine deaminase-related metal-dependent hydrolase
MAQDKRPPESANTPDNVDHYDTAPKTGPSRRDLLGSAAVGAALGALATAGLPPETLLAAPQGKGPPGGLPPGQAKKGIVLKGGVVLTMDPDGSDYAKADVRIEGSKIVAIGPNLGGSGAVIDCTGMIVMPGFINTHHHQYYTIQRAVIADGLLNGAWPQETYNSVPSAIWTTGRLVVGGQTIWDLGRSPYDPEDCYISELVASWAGIDAGVTTSVDTSQSSHTPEHTDAMIQGLMDSGRRTLYDYSGGRSDQPGYEFPGAIGNEDSGIGRLRKQWFSSDDQLVTLGAQFSSADLWPVARHYGAPMVFHGGGAALVANPDLAGPDQCIIHGTGNTDAVWQVLVDKGVHISIAPAIEMQMGHGTPPFQPALDRDILPSLSSDVDTNMTADMFTIMRTAFCLQRLLVNPSQPYAHAGKPHVNCRTVLKMATVAGAAAAGLSSKVGMLKVGMEADVIVLQARAINTHPMMNAPGTVVTMMDTSNVDTVIIGGSIKKQAGKLVGVNVEKLLQDVELAQQRVLNRIASVPIPVDGLHSAPGWTPNLLGSCCLADEPYPNATP